MSAGKGPLQQAEGPDHGRFRSQGSNLLTSLNAAKVSSSAERFYAIVDGRFCSKSIILTSNRAMTDWPALFPDPVMANAILDRLAHTSHQIVLKGQLYRKQLQVKEEE